MANKEKENVPNFIEVQKVTSLSKENPLEDPSSLFLVQLPEYNKPIKIKEQYLDELIYKLKRLKNA